jgi:hypothetical protein
VLVGRPTSAARSAEASAAVWLAVTIRRDKIVQVVLVMRLQEGKEQEERRSGFRDKADGCVVRASTR